MRSSLAVFYTTCTWALTASLAAGQCATGVHMAFARGTFGNYGTGYWAGLANGVFSRIPGSDAWNDPYPASPVFETSEPEGVKAMSNHIKNYTAMCPDTPVVPIGFSQGAQVVMDVLCGTSELTFLPTPKMTDKTAAHILGAVVYADLTRVPNMPYNLGSAGQGGHGLFQRSNPQDCAPFASRLQSYCNINDPFCFGGVDVHQHDTYFKLYDEDAADFIAQLYYAEYPPSNGTRHRRGRGRGRGP